jgi:hypothetical protein
MEPGAIGVSPYDLAAIVDPVGVGVVEGAGNINCGEAAGSAQSHRTALEHEGPQQLSSKHDNELLT